MLGEKWDTLGHPVPFLGILSYLTLININKKNTVVNLSSRNLSSDEESLLSKGLKALMNTDMDRHFNTLDHRSLEDVEIHIVDFIHITPTPTPTRSHVGFLRPTLVGRK